MEHTKATSVAEPRCEEINNKLSIVGISQHYSFEKIAGIPNQWQSFAPMIPGISDATKPTTFGVIYNPSDDGFDYLSGVELSSGVGVLDNLVKLDIAPQTYVVFQHRGHVATMRDTCDAIWSDWLPASNEAVIEAPWFERYGENFNPQTGEGGLEIWIPVSR